MATGVADWRLPSGKWKFVLVGIIVATGCVAVQWYGRMDRLASIPGTSVPGSPSPSLPFRIPEGYIAMPVAAPPLVKHPMFASFDDQGRLYVAGSSGHDLDAKALTRDPPDVIRHLEDTDGDGRFDTSTVFADHLTFPQGVLWHDGAVYTASPPSLWRLEDTDGDGVADRRQELVTGFPFTGIADDLHGPCLGPDGRIYWGVGRFDYSVRKPGGEVVCKGRTPVIMRCRPDGDEVEVFGAAMGNPVEMAFTAEGEPFACGTFLSPESQGAGLRDALIHCVYGGLYSVRDRDLATEKRTGDLLPPLAQLGVAAGSGMMRARGVGFSDSDCPKLYSAMFNLHSVLRHVLERDGSTFRATEEPFLESSNPGFHPTDVLEDADGSLLVVDTGVWFRHCPTSQIDRPDVLGGIYRIRRTAAAPVDDPYGRKIGWKGQNSRRWPACSPTHGSRFATGPPHYWSIKATRPYRHSGACSATVPGKSGPRPSGSWREWPAMARAAVRQAMRDHDAGVRLAAVTAAGLNRDGRAFDRLRELVQSGTPPVRREAATALGRLDRTEAVPALLGALRHDPDRFLQHALIFAMIRLGDRRATQAGLNDPDPSVRRGCLIALDQMPRGRMPLDLVRPMLEAPEPAVPRRRFGWLHITPNGPPRWPDCCGAGWRGTGTRAGQTRPTSVYNCWPSLETRPSRP